MQAGLRRLADAARMGLLPGGSVEDGILRTDRIAADPPADADELILDLYRRLPEVRITDILLEVDQATGFTDAFTWDGPASRPYCSCRRREWLARSIEAGRRSRSAGTGGSPGAFGCRIGSCESEAEAGRSP